MLLAKCDADPRTPTGISVRACARMQSMLSASITDIIPRSSTRSEVKLALGHSQAPISTTFS